MLISPIQLNSNFVVVLLSHQKTIQPKHYRSRPTYLHHDSQLVYGDPTQYKIILIIVYYAMGCVNGVEVDWNTRWLCISVVKMMGVVMIILSFVLDFLSQIFLMKQVDKDTDRIGFHISKKFISAVPKLYLVSTCLLKAKDINNNKEIVIRTN